MKNTAICYVTDIGYLLPSMISALSFRKFISSKTVGVFIFTIDVCEEKIKQINHDLQEKNIQVIPLNSDFYKDIDTKKYRKNHVPLAAVGRFFLDDVLPDNYSKIIYVDGDTWFANDPSQLLEYNIPEGYIAAADDTLQLQQHNNFGKFGKKTRAYYDSLGIDPKNGYFNSGVFCVSRDTWKIMSKKAFEYLKANTEKCLHHDQSALNATAGDKRIKLSCAWNFQTPYKYLDVEKKITPRIYHFSKYFKPWMGAVIPWHDLHDEFLLYIEKFKHLDLPIKAADQAALDRYNKKANLKLNLSKTKIFPIILKVIMGFYASEKKTSL